MAGRRPKPTALKELTGNPGGRPLNHDEPKPDICVPEMPKGMMTAAKREWKSITQDLLRLGLLTSVDGKALAGYCDAYAHWELARKAIAKHGLVFEEPITDPSGIIVLGYKLKANPAVAQYISLGKLMKTFLIEFGLTPTSRTKLKIERPKQEDDPMEAIMRGRGASAPVGDPAKLPN